MRLQRAAIFAVLATISSVVTPLLVPRIVSDSWGRSGLALYLLLQGWFGVLGLADAGIQTFVARESVAAVASGNRGKARALVRLGRRYLAMSIFLVALGAALFVGLYQTPPTQFEDRLFSLPTMRLAIFLQIICAAWVTYAGGTASILEFALGRDGAPTMFAVGQAMMQLVVLLSISQVAEPVIAFSILSMGPAILAAIRLNRGLKRFKEEVSTFPEAPIDRRWFYQGVLGSFALLVGQGLQLSLAPLILANRAPLLSTIAVPGRTLGNMAGKFPGILNAIAWAKLTRDISKLPDENRPTYLFSIFLLMFGLQLAAAAGLGVAGPTIFAMWLPNLASELPPLLPSLLVEQTVMAIATPINTLLFVNGQLRAAGLAAFVSGAILVCAIAFIPTLQSTSLANTAACVFLVVQLPLLGYAAVRNAMRGYGVRLTAITLASITMPILTWSGMIHLDVTCLVLAILACIALARGYSSIKGVAQNRSLEPRSDGELAP